MQESKAPRFSVMIPAFNAETTLAYTVDSVVNQTFGDWELVIVDDGSTDGTLALARRLEAGHDRVTVLTQENRGTGGAYNTAVGAARSDLLVILSADDYLLPEHLERFDVFIEENPEADIFSCGGYLEYADGSRVEQTLTSHWPDAQGCTLTDLFTACFFGVGAIFRREVYDDVGGFREDVYTEDYLFWLMALARGHKHRYLASPLAIHRMGQAQKSADFVKMRKSKADNIAEVMRSGLLTPAEMRAGRFMLFKVGVLLQLARMGLRTSR